MESLIRIPKEPSWFVPLVDRSKDGTAARRSCGVSSGGGTDPMGTSLVFFCALGGCLVSPDQAFFSGRSKSVPEGERIEELLEVLKNSGDEGARISAMGELRLLDTQNNKVIQGLIDTLKQDRKPGVRAEAAVSLARMRPVKPEVGQALEHAISKDASMRVRMQARSALLQYNLAGYRATSTQGATAQAQGDPLGQIVREVAPEAPGITKPNQWMGFQNNFIGPMEPGETTPAATAHETRPWMRPGKMVVGWFQTMVGGSRETPKNQPSGNAAIAPTVHNSPAPARTVSRSERGGAPGRTAGSSGSTPPSSLGNAGNPDAIPMFPTVPDFKPGTPEPVSGPDLGSPKR